MTRFTYMTDNEFLQHVEHELHAPSATLADVAQELTARLAHAVELVEDMEDNLAKLQAKYGITHDDLFECELTPAN